jgi:hypothetical protein
MVRSERSSQGHYVSLKNVTVSLLYMHTYFFENLAQRSSTTRTFLLGGEISSLALRSSLLTAALELRQTRFMAIST